MLHHRLNSPLHRVFVDSEWKVNELSVGQEGSLLEYHTTHSPAGLLRLATRRIQNHNLTNLEVFSFRAPEVAPPRNNAHAVCVNVNGVAVYFDPNETQLRLTQD